MDLIILNFSKEEAELIAPEGEYTILLNTGWEEFGGEQSKEDAGKLGGTIAPYGGLLLERMQG